MARFEATYSITAKLRVNSVDDITHVRVAKLKVNLRSQSRF